MNRNERDLHPDQGLGVASENEDERGQEADPGHEKLHAVKAMGTAGPTIEGDNVQLGAR